MEFQRKVALECSKRCMMHRPPKAGSEAAATFITKERLPEDELAPKYDNIKISHGE